MRRLSSGPNGLRKLGFLISVASILLVLSSVAASGGDVSSQLSMDDLRKEVAAAGKANPPWDGPRSGPSGQFGKSIALICEDLRNGGILGVAKGIGEAAKVLQWQVSVFDAGGTPAGRDKAAADAFAAGPDGVVLVGTDVTAMLPRLKPFTQQGVPMVGWHVGPKAGPMPGTPIAMNVSTDPLDVARITAAAAVVASEGRAGTVIFTDSNFAIAMTKANAMAEVIRACKDCALLEIRDLAISKCAEEMPAATRDLWGRYGQRWTYALAINDIYFDYATPELIKAGGTMDKLRFLSAGDGSAAAFMRISAGTFQTGTVAEPLAMHGWQLADELNRLLAHQPVSGYIAPVHLVTPENVLFDGGLGFQFDPDNGYREIYRKIWKP